MSTQVAAELYLKDVPRIGFDIHLSPFPGTLFALLEYIGDPCDYDYIMAVSGAAFRRLWNRDDGGNIDISYFFNDPFKRIFNALGYTYLVYLTEYESMLTGIRHSLAKGIPAISFGIFGPPEAGLVTGYEQNGEVLHGWSYFQDQGERYYRKDDWFETISPSHFCGMITLGDKFAPCKSEAEVLKDTLEWALELAHTSHRPGLPDHSSGLAAYDAWAMALEVDADYPADDTTVMGVRAMVHGDQSLMLEERRNAAGFLRTCSKACSQVAETLIAAADLYEQTAGYITSIWPWGIQTEDAIPGLSVPDTRREVAQAVRAAGACEAQALEQLEKVLHLLE